MEPAPTTARTIRRLWLAFAAVLVLTLAAGFLVPADGHAGIGATFGFGAWFGFGACAALILVAKALGLVLKRPDTYYDERRDD